MRTMPLRSVQGRVCRSSPAQPRGALRYRLGRMVGRCIAVWREWRRRGRSRALLGSFDEQMLRDIGVTRLEALQEINKPFWKE